MRITTKTEIPIKCDPGTDSVEGIAQAIRDLGVYGIGEKLSMKIARRFGRYAFDRMMDSEDFCYHIDGIGETKAFALRAKVMERFGPELKKKERASNEAQMRYNAFLGEIGAHGFMKRRINEMFADEDVREIERQIRENPYLLTDIDGVGFKRADEIAAKLGITGSDPRRIKAGMVYVLKELATIEGHCCLPREELTKKAAHKTVLDINREEVVPVMEQALTDGDLVEYGYVYLPDMLKAEQEVAERLQQLTETRGLGKGLAHSIAINATQDAGNIHYNDQQKEAVEKSLMFGCMVITGGPGTGKTTTLKAILRALGKHSYALCAPTGRAARRMKESTGKDAQTIHMLLEYQGTFGRNEDNPLWQDVVICDESSMIDLMLMRALLRAIKPGGRLILIGDNDQLPSVGAGRVLGDIIDSGVVPVVRLTEIYRQQDGSYIIQAAHDIIHGRVPDLRNRSSDFFFLPVADDDEAQQTVIDLAARRLPTAYPGKEVQVLCPMRKDGYKVGCNVLNPLLQQALNPDGWPMEISDYRLRRFDRVMQMKNNYRLGVYNGDVGEVMGMEHSVKKWTSTWDNEEHVKLSDEPELQVRYPDRQDTVGYDADALYNVELAYATTIHKSQGSEYDIVVIVMTSSAYIMLQRNLLYTAVTRAKEKCIIVGDRKAIETTVANWRLKPRWTRLKERLKM